MSDQSEKPPDQPRRTSRDVWTIASVLGVLAMFITLVPMMMGLGASLADVRERLASVEKGQSEIRHRLASVESGQAQIRDKLGAVEDRLIAVEIRLGTASVAAKDTDSL